MHILSFATGLLLIVRRHTVQFRLLLWPLSARRPEPVGVVDLMSRELTFAWLGLGGVRCHTNRPNIAQS